MPYATTFARWLRRVASGLVLLLDELLRRQVRSSWREDGPPEQVTLALKSTVRVRYSVEQTGAGG